MSYGHWIPYSLFKMASTSSAQQKLVGAYIVD